jgi:hypothetical protein
MPSEKIWQIWHSLTCLFTFLLKKNDAFRKSVFPLHSRPRRKYSEKPTFTKYRCTIVLSLQMLHPNQAVHSSWAIFKIVRWSLAPSSN